MDITSRAQHSAWTTSSVPDLERVRDGVWALPMLMEVGTLPSSFCYLVRDADEGVHIIDPGTDTEDNWGALVFALGRIRSSKSHVASIVVTHLHPDHLGLAETVRRATGAPIVMHRTEQAAMAEGAPWGVGEAEIAGWGVPFARLDEVLEGARRAEARPQVTADVLVDDGDTLSIPGRDIRVVHTPGHTTGHIALRDVGDALLFSGDHVLPDQNPGLGLGGCSATNPVVDYLDALDRVSVWDDHEVLPGHGYRFRGLTERATALGDHQRTRSAQVAAVLASRSDASVWDVASALAWSAGWDALRGFFLLSALAQTAMHVHRLQPAR